MTQKRHHNLSDAFGVLETLVVIALTAVLLALVVPLFSRFQEQSRSVACVANLRQISSAAQLYAQDYQGTYPPNRSNKAYWDEKHTAGVYHQDYLRPYLPTYTYRDSRDNKRRASAAPFWCPADLPRMQLNPQQSYGINQDRGGGADKPVNRKRVLEPYPAQCLYFVDATSGKLSTCLITNKQWPLGANALESIPMDEVRLDFRHGGKANVLFMDGHVEAFIPEALHGQNLFRITR